MSDHAPLTVIVGVQKSGTTLLNRLLQRIDGFKPIGPGEADAFWGNEPPFNPVEDPVGRLRLERGDDVGHELDAAQATPPVIELLRGRLDAMEASGGTPTTAFLAKSPYHAVRLPWLRTVFPRSTIVALVRRPAANVYSLMKKHRPHEGRGLPPDDSGWWGVKPSGWRALIDPDSLRQCLAQWIHTNERLLSTLDADDLVVDYTDLCARPTELLRRVVAAAGGDPGAVDEITEPISSRDDEHRIGSTLRSKNRMFRDTGTFETPDAEPAEFPPLDDDQIATIESEAGPLWRRLRSRATLAPTPGASS